MRTSPLVLVLASASPRRRELLSTQGLAFEIRSASIPEIPAPAEPPGSFALRIAGEKAAAVSRPDAPEVVLAADTVVTVDGALLGKPRDAAEAEEMLARLSGRRQEVITGVCVRSPGAEERFAVRTEVRFRPLSPEEIRWYVATGEPMDKAGGWAIQGIGGSFVESIVGSHSNVVGLPLAETLAALRRAGIAMPWEAR